MQRNIATYQPDVPVSKMKKRMLKWASQFSILIFLDSNEFQHRHSKYECLVGCGAQPLYQTDSKGDNADHLEELQRLHDTHRDWMFGHLCYDLKNELEPKLSSARAGRLGFPLLQFFIPETVAYIPHNGTELTIETVGEPDDVYRAIMQMDDSAGYSEMPCLNFEGVVKQDEYIDVIERLRAHIADGDCYEINYCNEAFCAGADIEPLSVFAALNGLSPAPFAAYYRTGDLYMMSASPERYLQKAGRTLRSQPMKGTARRDADRARDEELKLELQSNIKERAENVMITDLVRNDLARCCEPGSVEVEELFAIYTFPQVHQMVSTVSGTMREGTSIGDAIRCSFPMGSMTGAPKFKVMQLIEQYERSRRELYSGAVGYISPAGDFDFNVVIRSLFYNAATKYLSYHTGGAITYDSVPQKEWEELRLKAWALERIFSLG